MKKWILTLIIILCALIILFIALNKNVKNKFIHTEENKGIVNTEEEDKLLASSNYQEKLVQGMVNGINAFFK